MERTAAPSSPACEGLGEQGAGGGPLGLCGQRWSGVHRMSGGLGACAPVASAGRQDSDGQLELGAPRTVQRGPLTCGLLLCLAWILPAVQLEVLAPPVASLCFGFPICERGCAALSAGRGAVGRALGPACVGAAAPHGPLGRRVAFHLKVCAAEPRPTPTALVTNTNV